MSAGVPAITMPGALLERIERNIPQALLDLSVWLLHSENKVPMYADGSPRRGKLDSQEDRAKLVTFYEAANALLVQGAAGLGIALGPVPGTDLTVSGIDLDRCYRDTELDERVRGIVNVANSYTEKSPSGQGLHILGLGDIGTTKTKRGVVGLEIYSRCRYFTVTGDVVNGAGLVAIGEAAALARRLFDRQPTTAVDNAEPRAVPAGARNNFLTSEAGKLRRIGLDPSALSAALRTLNEQRCTPPLPQAEVEEISRGILRYPTSPTEPDDCGAVQLVRGTELTPEPISWLWSGWLARGKLHVLAGAPGCGKTTIALAFVAVVTAERHWPDETRAPVGNVLIWSGEDDFSDTLLPRLLAMGADLSRVYFVGGVGTRDGQRRPFDPAHDMESLYGEARKIGDVSLVIIDPIVSAVAGDSHKNTETRRSLQPLVDLAARLDAAVLGISHYTKGTQGRDPVERVTGSVAFGAVARIVMGAAKGHREEDGQIDRILVRAKSNIGPDGGGYCYRVTQGELQDYPSVLASSIVWGAPLDGSARALLATAENAPNGEERTALADAADFLRSELAGGDIASKELTRRAKETGISDRTLKRAKQFLGVRAHKGGSTGAWYCSLSPRFDVVGREGGQDIPTEILDLLGSLQTKQAHSQNTEKTSVIEEGQAGQEKGLATLVGLPSEPEAVCLK